MKTWVAATLLALTVAQHARGQLAAAPADLDRLCELQGRVTDADGSCGTCFDGFESADGNTDKGPGACTFARERVPRFLPALENAIENDVFGNGGNTGSFLRFADFDGDGLTDAFLVSAEFERKSGIAYLHNVGTASAPEFEVLVKGDKGYPFAKVVPGANSYLNFALGDLDGDGNLDVVLSSEEERNADDLRPNLYINNGADGFRKAGADTDEDPFRSLSEDFTNANRRWNDFPDSMSLVDIDGDNDLDLLLVRGNYMTITILENVGTATSPLFQKSGITFENVGQLTDVAAVDLDQDGLLDIVAMSTSFATFFFRNEGTASSPKFVLASDESNPMNEFRPVQPGCASSFSDECGRTLAFADLYGTGKLDAFVGTAWHTFYRHALTFAQPSAFVAVRTDKTLTANPLAGVPGHVDTSSQALTISFADIDGDDDLDAFVGTSEHGRIHFFRNDGPDSRYTYVGPNNTEHPFQGPDAVFDGAVHVNFLPRRSSEDPLAAIVAVRTGKTTNYKVDASWWEQASDGTMQRVGDVDLPKNEVHGATILAFGDLDGNGVRAYVSGHDSGKPIVAYDIDYASKSLVKVSKDSEVLGSSSPVLETCDSACDRLAFVDLNGDGVLDILFGSERGFVQVHLNEGTVWAPNFDFASADTPPTVFDEFSGTQRLEYAQPTLADTDGDGDLDLWVAGTGGVNLFENTAFDCASSCTRGRGKCASSGLSSELETQRASFGLASTSFAAGVCSCGRNFAGVACEQCDAAHYGPDCASSCPANSARKSPAGAFIYPDFPTVDDCECEGNFEPLPGADELTCLCAPGYSLQGTSCQLCRVNTFKATHGMEFCQACTNNMVTRTAGSTNCTCAPGYGFTGSGCEVCPLQTFKVGYGLGACETCPSGTGTSTTGSTQCVETLSCSPGFESSDGSSCAPCKPGFYNDGTSLVCRQCPISRPITAEEGTTSIDDCLAEEGSFFVPTQNASLACDAESIPSGALNCDSDGLTITTLELNAGYWRYSNQSLDIHKCPQEQYCRPRADARRLQTEDVDGPSDANCSPYHTGILCSECVEGFGIRSGGVCEECTGAAIQADKARTILWIVVMIVVALIPVALVVRAGCTPTRASKKNKLPAEKPSLFSRFMTAWISSVTYLMNVAVKARLTLVFLQIYREFLLTTDILGSGDAAGALGFIISIDISALATLLNLGCSPIEVNFYSTLLATTIWPLGVLALLALAALCFRRQPTYSIALRWAIWLGLELLFVVYASVSSRIIRTFLTRPFERYLGDNDPFETLDADTTIDYASAESAGFRVYAGIMLAVYPIGTAALFYGLWWKKNSLTPEWKRAAHFLWDPYKPHVGFYESVELLRRFLLTSAFVLLTQVHAEIAVIAFTACVVVFALVVQGVKPYASQNETMVISNQVFAHFMLLLLLLLGFCGLLRNYLDENLDALQGCVVAIGAVGFAVGCLVILMEMRAFWRSDRGAAEIKEGDAETPSEPQHEKKAADVGPATPIPVATSLVISEDEFTGEDPNVIQGVSAPRNTPETKTSISRASEEPDGDLDLTLV